MLPGGGGLSSLVLLLLWIVREIFSRSFGEPPDGPDGYEQYYYDKPPPVVEELVVLGPSLRSEVAGLGSGLTIVIFVLCCCCCRQTAPERKGRRLILQLAP